MTAIWHSLSAMRHSRHWLRPVLALLLGLGLGLGLAGAVAAADREALLMPGKTSLYQRVLTRPGAALRSAPEDAARAGAELPPLSLLYVYSRRDTGGTPWLEVGPAAEDAPEGWLPASLAIDWHQTLTVAFTRTSNRQPVLFFRDREGLVELMESQKLAHEAAALRSIIDSRSIPEGFPAVAKEPDTYVDPNQQFYLLPILGYERVFLETGLESTLLRVAAVTLVAGEQDTLSVQLAEGRASLAGAARDFRAGVVFVIDSTTSMGPYIDRTRAAVQRVFERLKGSPMGDALSFGLVAFRDNVEAAPGLEYVSRVVATLKDGQDPADFFSRVNQVQAAEVSSRGFDEDAFAGVYDAIESIDWRGYAARFVVLVTDAGAREANDPLARTRLGADRLRVLAQEKDQALGGAKIAIAALHLLTPEGQKSHQHAASQYRELTRWGDAGDLYFPVAGGTVEQFGTQVDALADTLVQQLGAIRSGQLVEVREDSGASEMERKTALVGRAMQLAYLGRERGSQAPRLIDAWVSDRSLEEPSRAALEVRALITKNQLSNLQETLEAIFAAGERTRLSAKDFFAQLRGAAAALARDPERVSTTGVRRLADVGLVGEWLDDLPYTSQVMNLTESRWLTRSYAEQQEVLDAIEEKIRLYRRIHDDSDRWIDLSGRSSKGEAVTTVPLDALP